MSVMRYGSSPKSAEPSTIPAIRSFILHRLRQKEGFQMDKERKDKQGVTSSVSSRAKTENREAPKLDNGPAEEVSHSGIWVREDGAICVGNDCVSFKTGPSNEMELTIDPDKCPCDVADKFLDTISAGVLSGKGVTVTMKPRTKNDQESHK